MSSLQRQSSACCLTFMVASCTVTAEPNAGLRSDILSSTWAQYWICFVSEQAISLQVVYLWLLAQFFSSAMWPAGHVPQHSNATVTQRNIISLIAQGWIIHAHWKPDITGSPMFPLYIHTFHQLLCNLKLLLLFPYFNCLFDIKR